MYLNLVASDYLFCVIKHNRSPLQVWNSILKKNKFKIYFHGAFSIYHLLLIMIYSKSVNMRSFTALQRFFSKKILKRYSEDNGFLIIWTPEILV